MQDNQPSVNEEDHKEMQRRARELIMMVKEMPPENRKILMETLERANQLKTDKS